MMIGSNKRLMLARTDPFRHGAAVWSVMINAQNEHGDTQRHRADKHHEYKIDTWDGHTKTSVLCTY